MDTLCRWMRRRTAASAVVFSLVVALVGLSSASAQESPEIDIQNFEPALGPHAVFSVSQSGTVPHLQPAGQVYLGYLSKPLVRGSGESENAVVDQQLVGDALAGIGVTERGQVGIHMPFYMINEGAYAGETFEGASLGDLSLQPKYQFLTHEMSPVGLAARVDVTLPTGNEEAFTGSPGVAVDPMLIADMAIDRTRVAANFGASFTRQTAVENLDVGSRFDYGVGLEYEVVEGLLEVGGELYGDTPFGEFLGSVEDSPLEGILGAKVRTGSGLVVKAGGGGGIVAGVGSPEFRAFVGLGYPGRVTDSDDDGIPDAQDQCPNEPEDEDGFEDDDGCPDPDNDGDGIPDDEDECPDEAGVEAENGCPKTTEDSDGDGIPDSEDECPEKPEDEDGFEDDDGCPDPDNDGDGIPDDEDECPDEAGVEAENGCPKTTEDSDDDGIPDSEDECPETPGVEEQDGCPADADGDGIPDEEDECPEEPGLEKNDGCPAEEKKAVRKDEKIEIREKVYFEYDKAVIKEESYGVLDSVALVLRTNPDIDRTEIQGHTDDVGGAEYNENLSRARAKAVKRYLSEEGDVDAERLVAKGYGATQPLVPNNSDDNRAKNRRVEFKILDNQDGGDGEGDEQTDGESDEGDEQADEQDSE